VEKRGEIPMTLISSLILTLCAAPLIYTIFIKSRDDDEKDEHN
jgi:hypothetical protein